MSEDMWCIVAIAAYLPICVWVGHLLRRRNRELLEDEHALRSARQALEAQRPPDGQETPVLDLDAYRARRAS